jgi:hypothetical protein
MIVSGCIEDLSVDANQTRWSPYLYAADVQA